MLGAVWVALVVIFGYLLTYAVFAHPPKGSVPPGTDAAAFLRQLYPQNLLGQVLSDFSSAGGGPIALILGALTAGSEYSWGTPKTVFTQRPGRFGVFFGKALVAASILLLFTLLAFAAGAASSYVVAGLENAPRDWPDPADVLRAVGAGWLIMAVWGFLGVFLATLLRGPALAIGLGLVYSLVLEGIAANLLARNENFDAARRFLLGENSDALSGYFGKSPPTGFGAQQSLVSPERAAVTLAAYVVGFVLLSALLLRRRDVG